MSNEDLAAEEDKREGIDAADLKVSLNFERISRLFPYLSLLTPPTNRTCPYSFLDYITG